MDSFFFFFLYNNKKITTLRTDKRHKYVLPQGTTGDIARSTNPKKNKQFIIKKIIIIKEIIITIK